MSARRLLGDVVALLIVGAVALTLWPARLGGDTSLVLVQGASMEPHLHGGNLVVVRAADEYRLGDVVAYRIPDGDTAAGNLVIHRIIGTADGGFVVQGDNRSTSDSWRPSRDDVLGREVVTVPLPVGQLWSLFPWICSGLVGTGVVVALWPRGRRARAGPPWPAPQGPPVWAGELADLGRGGLPIAVSVPPRSWEPSHAHVRDRRSMRRTEE